MPPRKTAGTRPTLENGLTVFTAAHAVESTATSVRIWAHVKGKREKGCRWGPSAFVDKLIKNANNFIDSVFGKDFGNESNGETITAKLSGATIIIRGRFSSSPPAVNCPSGWAPSP